MQHYIICNFRKYNKSDNYKISVNEHNLKLKYS